MKYRRFIITNPPQIFILDLFLIIFFIVLLIFNTLFSPPPHEVMYICVSIFVFIPCIIVIIWTKAFKIEVESNLIKVRKCFGLINYSFNLSEITNIDWKINNNRMGQIVKVTIRTIDGKTTSIENVMVNSDKMIKLLNELGL